MRILEAKNYEEMSALAAGIIGAQVLLQPRCVLGLATGSSPIGTYEKLVEAHRAGRLDFSQVRTVNLDEYCGLSGDNPQSYRYFMEKHLFSQVNLPWGRLKAKNIVVDPVMVATSGAKLLRDDAVEALCRELLPLAAVLTPNIPEAEILSGMTITDATGMEAAAKYISEKYGCAVLCKGGHKVNDADDLLWRNGFGKWFHGKRIDNPNTHGTGCTLSSAIASNLAKGYDLDESVERAKEYISGALAAMLDLGHGSGPMNHMFALKGAFTE